MTAAPSDPLPPTALPEVPSTPAAALGRLSASGVALLQAGRFDEAVDVLQHAVAAAHAVETSREIERPDERIWLLREAISDSPINSWSTAGTGSCHSCGSGTHGPR